MDVFSDFTYLLASYFGFKKQNKIKLVFGNGFDLYCNLKTKYIDFFESEKNKYAAIKKWKKSFNAIPFLNNKFRNLNIHFTISPINFNIWDIYFALGIGEKDKNWCDIEVEMKKSFVSKGNVVYWPNVYSLLEQKSLRFDLYKELEIYIASYIIIKKIDYSSKQKFYNSLLDELKIFEKNFGNYVNNQYESKYNEYVLNSNKFFNSFPKKEIKKISSKETFNYTNNKSFPFDKKSKMLRDFHHINGDYYNPIFGVDSKDIEVNKPFFIFTKVSRRLINAATYGENIKSSFSKPFSKLIVFGHSLNANDYNYFFPIFDYLGLTNISRNTSVVFAYYVYDIGKKESIILEYISKVTQLIDSYEEYAGKNKDNRLIDSLTAQGRIKIIEIKKD